MAVSVLSTEQLFDTAVGFPVKRARVERRFSLISHGLQFIRDSLQYTRAFDRMSVNGLDPN